jgi:hypothetical protein
LIKELQEACRRSLYNGNNIGTSLEPLVDDQVAPPESETASHATSSLLRLPSPKRRRRDKMGKFRSWETVRHDNMVISQLSLTR